MTKRFYVVDSLPTGDDHTTIEVIVDDAQCAIWINGQQIEDDLISTTDVDGG